MPVTQMKHFANVPVDSVLNTLGIQLKPSHTIEVINFNLPYCDSCINSLIDSSACESCSYRPSSVTVRGFKDSFDTKYNRTLKSAAVKTFISLFFYADSTGCINNLDINTLADFIGCHKKTIVASLLSLEDVGYLSLNKINPRLYDVTILNYTKMYAKACNGGCGFITLDLATFTNIVNVKGLNTLRCLIKLFFNAAFNEIKSASKLAAARLSFKDLRKSLPPYVKPFILREALSQIRPFFCSVDKSYDTLIVVLDKKYQGKALKARIKEDAKSKFSDFIANFNRIIEKANAELKFSKHISLETKLNLEDLDIIQSPEGGLYPVMYLNSDTRNDLIDMAPEYGTDAIIDALKTLYAEYIAVYTKVTNIGGLIRKILMERTGY